MDYTKMLFLLVGGLGLFFYGMHTLSESLQGIAGDMMRKVINILTSNRIIAVSVGIFVTMLVQSSSITTVMIVGFVNAGLMKLTQALGVIFGANIGTTITGWIITIKIGKYGLPMLGLGAMLYIFSKPYRLKLTGKLIFALGAIFFGLQQMSSAFKPLRTNEEFISYLSVFAGETFLSVLACVAMGAILTMIVQSSSAMLAITIALAVTDVISFRTGAALVLGENIGTTITAMLASIGTTYNARRAAYGHMAFNLLGVFIMVVIFAPYIQMVEWLVPGAADFVNPSGEKPNVAAHIATVHTIFNVSATIIFLPFLPLLARFVSFLVPEPEERRPHQLTNLMNVSAKAPALAMEQVYGETRKMASLVEEAIVETMEVVISTDENRKKKDHIHHIEDIADKIQFEITVFLGDLMEARLPPELSTQVFGLVDIVDNLESISDYCASIAKYKDRIYEENQAFKEETRQELLDYLEKILDFYRHAIKTLDNDNKGREHVQYCKDRTKSLGDDADKIKEVHLRRIKEGHYPPIMSLVFSDMVVSMRRIKNHTLNIAEALHLEE